MENNRVILAVMRDAIEQMPDEEKMCAKEAIEDLRSFLGKWGDSGKLAIGVVGLELSLEDE